MKIKGDTYITHHCKNPECNNAWVDIDLKKSKRPPNWKYCPNCIEKGFINPKEPPKSKVHSEKMKKYHQEKRKIN